MSRLGLTMRIGERLMIDEGKIIITLISFRNRQARVMIDAPKEIKVDRERIFIRKKLEASDGTG